MPVYQRIFSIGDIADIHLEFRNAVRLTDAIERLRPGFAAATRGELLRAYSQFNRDLNDLAQATARNATAQIVQRLNATAVRPDTGTRPHLRNLIRSRPLKRFGAIATGEVGVADEQYLNRAIDPMTPQYGTYWRAQEFGNPSMQGREVFGYFTGPGYTPPFTRPQAARNRQDPRFWAAAAGARGPRGGKGGKLRIQHVPKPRHFIRDGANLAEAVWRAEVRAIEQRTVARLGAVLP